jgi:hypothetical protein
MVGWCCLCGSGFSRDAFQQIAAIPLKASRVNPFPHGGLVLLVWERLQPRLRTRHISSFGADSTVTIPFCHISI